MSSRDVYCGNHVTIGAGSVVLDSIPDHALVVGRKTQRVKVSMSILQLCTRLAERCGGVALDLHLRAHCKG